MITHIVLLLEFNNKKKNFKKPSAKYMHTHIAGIQAWKASFAEHFESFR